MALYILIFILSIFVSILLTYLVVSKKYQTKLLDLQNENLVLKNNSKFNENLLNEMKLEFSQIAKDSIKQQQENLIEQHSQELKNKFEYFKMEEISPINNLLKEFKLSIDNYQKEHKIESLDIKNAITTAEKYAKALTVSHSMRGECSENQLEQILNYVNLEENIHYFKQYTSQNSKPDFVIKLPNNKHLVIDSKAILKNYFEYVENDVVDAKMSFINDLEQCITNLSKKNYEEIENLNQPNFILMYIPVENCISMIYTDYDFAKVLSLANSRNIVIVGSASLLVTLKLVTQLWASQTQYDNVKNIITVGQNLYDSIATHSKALLLIQTKLEELCKNIQTEINRFTSHRENSVFKQAEKLRDYGISLKEQKSGKKIQENTIQKEFLGDNNLSVG